MNNIFQNSWFIAIASSVVSIVVVSLLHSFSKLVRSLFGIYSGQYVSITEVPPIGNYLIENVRCRHWANRLTGKINGVAVLDRKSHSNLGENQGNYQFTGFVKERVIVLSYQTTVSRLHSIGAISMKADALGFIFSGSWIGLVNNNLKVGKCKWIRISPPISARKNREYLINYALQMINFNSIDEVIEFQSLEKFYYFKRVQRDKYNFLSQLFRFSNKQ